MLERITIIAKKPNRQFLTQASFITAVLAMLLSIANTSTTNAQRFHGGIKAGLVASEVSGDQLAGPTKAGFFGSVYTFTPISDYAFLQLEIKYIQKGSRAPATERNIERNMDDYRFSLQYVEVPVLFIYNITRFTDQRFFEQLLFHSGVSVSVLVDYYESRPQNPKQEFHPAEANILLGMSYPISPSLDFNFGFSQGVTPIRPHASATRVWYNWGQYNTAWNFGLSYTIW